MAMKKVPAFKIIGFLLSLHNPPDATAERSVGRLVGELLL